MRALAALFALFVVAATSEATRFDPVQEAIVSGARQFSRIAMLPKSPGLSAFEVERLATVSGGVVLRRAYARGDGSWSLSADPRQIAALRDIVQSLRRSGEFIWVELDSDQLHSQAKRAAQQDELSSIAGIRSLIVTVADQASFAARLAEFGSGLHTRRQLIGDVWVIELPTPTTYENAVAIGRELIMAGIVKYADPDMPVTKAISPNDPAFVAGGQWALLDPFTSSWKGIQMEPVWDVTEGDPNLVIAVVDTGVRPHSEIASRLLTGYTFISNPANSHDGLGWHAGGSDPGDWSAAGECGVGTAAESSSWHGTHVAGIIAATGNNAIGTAGINWRSKILPVRVLGTCGGATSDILTGMLWAAGVPVPGAPPNLTPARVINMSLGGPGTCTPQYQSIVNQALSTGALVVAAAGNETTLADLRVPASCLGLATVGATGPSGDRAHYSNVSLSMDISAPGGDIVRFGQGGGILSTWNNGTTTPTTATWKALQGTSMAAPHVSGVASMMLSLNPNLFPADLKALMALLPTPFAADSLCNFSICGAGIVNATSSVLFAGLVALLSTVPVVEYYHAGFDHYFITANANEIALLDGGAFGGAWARTGGVFRAFSSPAASGLPVCRFFSAAFAPKSSHFYTANASECSSLKANPYWVYEGIAFYVPMPSVAGTCQQGTLAVYRMYNNGQGASPNHRFTSDLLVQKEFASQRGWIAEGAGALGVGMCSPQF